MHKTSLSFPPGFLVVHQPVRAVLGLWKTGSDNVSHSDCDKVIKKQIPWKSFLCLLSLPDAPER